VPHSAVIPRFAEAQQREAMHYIPGTVVHTLTCVYTTANMNSATGDTEHHRNTRTVTDIPN